MTDSTNGKDTPDPQVSIVRREPVDPGTVPRLRSGLSGMGLGLALGAMSMVTVADPQPGGFRPYRPTPRPPNPNPKAKAQRKARKAGRKPRK